MKNRSALGCILGTVLGLATWNTTLIYGSSFIRQVFGIPLQTLVIVNVFLTLTYIAGSLAASKSIKTFGFKKTLLIAAGVLGCFTILGFNALNYLMAILLFMPVSARVRIKHLTHNKRISYQMWIEG